GVAGIVGPVVLGAAVAAAASADRGSPRAVDLRTEHRVNPIGIDEAAPLLAWKLDGTGSPQPQGQQAYQIRVARSPAPLRRENAAYVYTQPDGSETPLPVFGKSFQVDGRVARARLYITGLGMYAATLNGRAVSDHVLEPGQTTYSAEVHYRTCDVGGQLQQGV